MLQKKYITIGSGIISLLILIVGVCYYFYDVNIQKEYRSRFGDVRLKTIELYLEKKYTLIKEGNATPSDFGALNKTLTHEEYNSLVEYLAFDESIVRREKQEHPFFYRIYLFLNK